jgi:E3 ubiquitin-protein ligase UBR3
MLELQPHKALELYSSKSDGFLSREGSSAANSYFQEGGRLLAELFPTQYHVPGFAAVLMEHPLHLQVLCAHLQAGMWHHNSYSASDLCDLVYSGCLLLL